MAASPCAAHLISCQIFAAVHGVVRIGRIRAAHPLPAVACHVEDAEGTGAVGNAGGPQIVPAAAEMRARKSGGSLPQGNLRPSVPRAAFSPSASVGSRLPNHLQYSTAPNHDASTTG